MHASPTFTTCWLKCLQDGVCTIVASNKHLRKFSVVFNFDELNSRYMDMDEWDDTPMEAMKDMDVRAYLGRLWLLWRIISTVDGGWRLGLRLRERQQVGWSGRWC